MEIRNSFDPNEKRIQLIVTSNLLNNYFPNFSGMIKNSSKRLDLTEDQLRVEKTGKNTAIISFPLPVDSQIMKMDEQKMAVSMNPLSMEILNDSINCCVFSLAVFVLLFPCKKPITLAEPAIAPHRQPELKPCEKPLRQSE